MYISCAILLVMQLSQSYSYRYLHDRIYAHEKDRYNEKKGREEPEVFTAVLSSNSTAGTIKFDDVRINLHGSYDQSSGIFTAYQDGTYAFYWTAVSSQRFTRTELRVNIDVRGVAESDLLPVRQFILDEVANAATLSLKERDQVYIKSNNTLLCGSVFAGTRLRTVNNQSVFYARSVDQLIANTDPVQFQDVLLNNTNGDFDGATFTASSDGLYVFTASASAFAPNLDMDILQDNGDVVEPDELLSAGNLLYTKSVSTTIVLRLERDTNDRIRVTIDRRDFPAVPINERSIFTGYKLTSDDDCNPSAITVTAFDGSNFNCPQGCIAFSDNPEVFLNVNGEFNVNTGVFTATRSGVYGIAVAFDTNNIPTIYNIEVSNMVLFTGRANGPGIDANVFNFSKRVVFQHLNKGDTVKVSLTGNYRSGSSLSIWNLLVDY